MADSQIRLGTVLSGDAIDGDAHVSPKEGENASQTGPVATAAREAALKSCRETFVSRITSLGGRLIRTDDGSLLATFGSAVTAIRCAVDVDEALREKNASLPSDRRVQFRVGIHLGDYTEEPGGAVRGTAVKAAIRLRDLSPAGGICISGNTYDLIADKTDFRFEEIGPRSQDVPDRPVRAFRVIGAAGRLFGSGGEAGGSRPSIAVLPFDNLGGNVEDEYYADGIVEDLITALSRIRWLTVIARNSTFTYKGKAVDVKRVGKELGVRYILEGSIRRGGDRVRINAQLIETVAGGHIWARRYDRQLQDIFSVQDELTASIAGEIEPELAEVERERSVRKAPGSLTAWDIYQQGLWHMWKLSAHENEEGQRLFQRSSEIDPGFAPAMACLAYSRYMDQALGFRATSREDLLAARELALRAISIDRNDAMAHCTIGRIETALGNHAAAIGELETAIKLNPNFALAHHGRAMCLTLTGCANDAIPEFELATRLSPRDPYLYAFQVVQAAAYNVIGIYKKGEELSRFAANHPNAGMWAYAHLAQALAGQGRLVAAKEAVDKLLEVRPEFSPTFFNRLWPNCSRAFLEPYWALLEKAGLENGSVRPPPDTSGDP